MKFLYIIASLLIGTSPVFAQTDEEPQEEEPTSTLSVYWGFKGGLTMATQKWNNFQRRSLFAYHAGAVLELLGRWSTANGPRRRFGVGIGLGYHQRGSAYRVNNAIANQPRPRDVFHNIGLLISGLGQFQVGQRWLMYYGLGLRAEFTPVWSIVNPSYDPYVRRLNYGVWFAVGAQFMLGKTSLFLELSLAPDVSRQVFVPQGVPLNIIDPFTGLNVVSTGEKVNNLSLEVSLGVKFGRNDLVATKSSTE